MIPIAVVLLIIVLIFSVGLAVGNPQTAFISIFRAQISMNPAGVYFTGAGAMLVLILALALLRVGLRRSATKRREMRALKQAAGGNAVTTPATTTTATDPSSVSASPSSVSASSSSAEGTVDHSVSPSAERQALLDEAQELTGDDPKP